MATTASTAAVLAFVVIVVVFVVVVVRAMVMAVLGIVIIRNLEIELTPSVGQGDGGRLTKCCSLPGAVALKSGRDREDRRRLG